MPLCWCSVAMNAVFIAFLQVFALFITAGVDEHKRDADKIVWARIRFICIIYTYPRSAVTAGVSGVTSLG